MLVCGEEKTIVAGGKPLEARTTTNIKTQPTYMPRQVWESYSGHIGGRRVLSPLCYPFSPSVIKFLPPT